jgi:phage head maturation protease
MNTYARVKRGDVSQCSIGFEILSEETDFGPDGSIHWTIQNVKLYEVSVCTFPAYEETNVSARQRDASAIKERKLDAWKAEMRSRINSNKEEKENAEGIDAQEEDQ